MIKEAISKLVMSEDLCEKEASDVMTEIMSGEATEAQIASFITALRMKGETIDEVAGCARIMRKFATPISVKANVDVDRDDINIDNETIVDTCGTGGDKTNTFNVSTTTAFVLAACALKVAKHGNRAVSSACGSADVLEALGVNLNIPKEKVEECISKIGIGFLFAPSLHGAMKYAIGPRRQIGIRTIFNMLGPLTNPAAANCQVLGVYSKDIVSMLANVLKKLGTKRAWVVHGGDGTDEISITSETFVCELKDGKISEFTVKPEDFNLKRAKLIDIKGGNAKDNAEIVKNVLSGEKGPKLDVVLINSAAGLLVSGKAKDIKDGINIAKNAIDSKKALKTLEELIKMTNA